MTIAELMKDVGKVAEIALENGLTIKVTVRDVKQSYGRSRWLVEPLAGHGQAWVEKIII